ncbi:MAG: polyhydroxyalkanoic acid system family protein [Nannocystaceae bacterium]|nr:polyhydroxyalkanoic acid system family protein [Myxococcales bacterium]
MADISLSRNHSVSTEVLAQRLEGLQGKLKDKFGVESTRKGDNKYEIKGKGVSGELTYDSSKIAIDVKLGFALKMLKGKITSALEEELNKVTAPE